MCVVTNEICGSVSRILHVFQQFCSSIDCRWVLGFDPSRHDGIEYNIIRFQSRCLFDFSQQFFRSNNGMGSHPRRTPSRNYCGICNDVFRGLHFLEYPVGVFRRLSSSFGCDVATQSNELINSKDKKIDRLGENDE